MPFLFTCPHCRHQTHVSEQFAGQSGPCASCGRVVDIPPLARPVVPDMAHSAAMRMLLPVGRSGLAIAAGYMGLFAVLFIPAPIALGLGIAAIRNLKKHPEKHGLGRAIFGVVMGAVFTIPLVIGVVALACTPGAAGGG